MALKAKVICLITMSIVEAYNGAKSFIGTK